MQPAIRFSIIAIAVCIVDAIVVLFARKPLPWAAIIPGAIPILVAIFVIGPMNKKKSKA